MVALVFLLFLAVIADVDGGALLTLEKTLRIQDFQAANITVVLMRLDLIFILIILLGSEKSLILLVETVNSRLGFVH
jgi:hypothetical protein